MFIRNDYLKGCKSTGIINSRNLCVLYCIALVVWLSVYEDAAFQMVLH